MAVGIELSTLQRVLDQIDKKYPKSDDIVLVKNRVGNLTVVVNGLALGYIDLNGEGYKEWPDDWQYPIEQHETRE